MADGIYCGDAAEVCATLQADSAQMILTSPPYFGHAEPSDDTRVLGSEASVADYVERLVAVLGECRRVLRRDGTMWLNLGDKFHRKQLLGRDRPTVSHEHLFLLTRSRHYFYNPDAIREPHVTFTEQSKMSSGRRHFGLVNGTPEAGKYAGDRNLHQGRWDQAFHPLGRNRRTVWSIPTARSSTPHFAMMPARLAEVCILAGSREGSVVLDPFLGAGTTALVAAGLGRRT